MTILNGSQIAQYAYKAGFRGQALNTAVAIALAESGGNTNAYNPESAAGTPAGSGSRGLWQIYGVAHPEFNNDSAFDPAINAQAAFKVFVEAGNRFTPWSTYNAGMANNPRDYASQVGGFLMNVVRGQKPPQQVRPNQNVSALQSQMGGGTTATPETSAPEKIASAAVSAITGGRAASDLTFYFMGVGLIFVAIIFLLVMFVSSDTGKEAIKLAAAA